MIGLHIKYDVEINSRKGPKNLPNWQYIAKFKIKCRTASRLNMLQFYLHYQRVKLRNSYQKHGAFQKNWDKR